MKARGAPIDRDAPLLMKLTDPEEDGVWGDLEQPFVGFKIASMTHKKRQKTSPEKVHRVEKEVEEKPKWMQDEEKQDESHKSEQELDSNQKS